MWRINNSKPLLKKEEEKWKRDFLFIYRTFFFPFCPKMIKVNECLLGKPQTWYSGKIRAALQISSENLLGHKVISHAPLGSPQCPGVTILDNVKYWEPEDGMSFKDDFPGFIQILNCLVTDVALLNAFRFWPLGMLSSKGYLSYSFSVVRTGGLWVWPWSLSPDSWQLYLWALWLLLPSASTAGLSRKISSKALQVKGLVLLWLVRVHTGLL